MSELRVGVVGYGLRGSLARYAHRPGEGSVVVAVCDPSPRSRDLARQDFGDGAAYVATLDELLACDLDAVMVLSPDDLHADHARRTLSAGLATFLEKPMAITIEDADAILASAREHRARLYVGHNMRHMPVVRQMKGLIDAGAIGNVRAVWCRHFVGNGGDFYFKDWHAEARRTTGLLLQKGAHDIDVVHWLSGGYSEQVQGIGDLAVYGAIADRRDNSDRRMRDWFSPDNWPPAAQTGLNPVIDVEDISMISMRLDNGVLASYEQCHFTPDYWRNYTVIGDAGRLENMGDEGGDQIHLWTSRHSRPGHPDRVEVIRRETGSHGGADPSLVAEFVSFARDGGRTEVSAVAARQAVAAGVIGTESIRSGGGLLPVPPLNAGLRAYFDQGQC